MALTKKQHAAREGKVNASFIPALMAGDEKKINNEWRWLVGDPDWEPEDLSYSWPVQFGSYVEKFALDWHEKKTGQKLNGRGKSLIHPTLPHIGCTLDAYRTGDDCVIDCKVVGKWRSLEEVVSYYTPQVYVQRACLNAKKMYLLVVHGGAEPVEIPIAFDQNFDDQIFARIAEFWQCVETMTIPYPMPPIVAPADAIREYDFATNNEWCSHAGAWLEHREAAKKFDVAVKEIKSATPDDAQRAKGGGIIVTRNKAGSLSIKEQSK